MRDSVCPAGAAEAHRTQKGVMEMAGKKPPVIDATKCVRSGDCIANCKEVFEKDPPQATVGIRQLDRCV